MLRRFFRSKEFKNVNDLLSRVLKNDFLHHTRRIRLVETTFISLNYGQEQQFHVEDKKTGARRPLGTIENIDYSTMHQALQEIVQQITIYENANLTASQKRLLQYVHGKRRPLFDIKSPEGPIVHHKKPLFDIKFPQSD